MIDNTIFTNSAKMRQKMSFKISLRNGDKLCELLK